MSWHVRVLPNRYADSVGLMGVARAVRDRPGVRRCELAMGTEANLEALSELGASCDASAGDVVIAVDADDEEAAEALGEAEQALSSLRRADGDAERPSLRPRSLAGALRDVEEPNLALISVPGEYAALEAHRALSCGLHVFLFSDHVSLEDELALKRRGVEAGLLVMGPECGTAMLGGVGLGFANVVRPGSVGVVAAAGTGAQEVACLLDAAGAGLSHIIGVGGRDLSPAIGGMMFREAMRVLAQDASTDTLLVVSKSPSREVVGRLGEELAPGKRVVAAFVGWEDEGEGEGPFEIHATLAAGAHAAAGAPADDGAGALADAVLARRSVSAGGFVRGLYSGGTLAHEAVCLLERALGPVAGNVGSAAGRDAGHAVFDLGTEEYTRGRPHPMVDLDTRLELLAQAAREPQVGCVLLDVVLGHGAHPDPASALAPIVSEAAAGAQVIVRVCGTPADPQDADAQSARLAEAGAVVAPSNASAVGLALQAVRS